MNKSNYINKDSTIIIHIIICLINNSEILIILIIRIIQYHNMSVSVIADVLSHLRSNKIHIIAGVSVIRLTSRFKNLPHTTSQVGVST